MKIPLIVSKANKSLTLAFNWIVTIAAVAAEVAIQNVPALQQAVAPEHYIYVIIGISVVNKLLRNHTTKALEDK